MDPKWFLQHPTCVCGKKTTTAIFSCTRKYVRQTTLVCAECAERKLESLPDLYFETEEEAWASLITRRLLNGQEMQPVFTTTWEEIHRR